ncbi:hypothetical protein GCM10010305_04590 [Streptomyces termitum]|uniref:Uncharacterized protein n=1 Tax=Streptomyces termitum TaxID=67368 RepID=A0A918W589_9ACTN|nr:hypothetical protein GCM10010305_04590 [Streptomyces termitum]
MLALVKHLPRGSAVHRELHGEAAEWSVTDHLLAAAVDHLAAANWMFVCANTGEDDERPDPPKPVPRPEYGDPDGGDDPGATAREGGGGEPEEAVPTVSAGELARFFG